MPAPKVDDQYWFDYSAQLVKAALESRDGAADRIQKFTLWLWGIYTASAAIGFTLAAKKLSAPATVLITLPCIALIGVYWATVWVQTPRSVEFDPRSPDDIRAAYADSVKAKAKRLRVVLILSLVSIVLVAAGLIAASLSRESKPGVTAAVRDERAGRVLALAATVPGASRLRVEIRAGGDGATEPHEYPLTSTGTLQTEIGLTSKADSYDVTVSWTDGSGRDQARLSITRTVDMAPPPSSPAPGSGTSNPATTTPAASPSPKS